MLIAGMVMGSLATILWQGMRTADGGVGTGIRSMIEQSKKQDQLSSSNQSISVVDIPVKQKTDFDFFTVLPEIEVVVPTFESDPEPVAKVSETSTQVDESPSPTKFIRAGAVRRRGRLCRESRRPDRRWWRPGGFDRRWHR